MSLIRLNDFHAAAGKARELSTLLNDVAKRMLILKGCQSCEVLESQDKPLHFVVLEVWESRDAHQAAAQTIPPDTLQKAMQLLAEPPRGEYFSTGQS